MIHSQTLKELTEEELSLLWAVAQHYFHPIGLQCKYSWLKMVRVDVLEHILGKCNIKEEYKGLCTSLLEKVKG